MSQWKKIWGYVPTVWGIPVETVENLTQKVWIRTNGQGDAVRIRLQNLENPEALIVEHITVGRWDSQKQQITDIRDVTYEGKTRIEIPAGASFYSDSVELPLQIEDDLVISLYIKEKQTLFSACQTWCAGTWNSLFTEGDQTETADYNGTPAKDYFEFFKADENPCCAAYAVCGVQLLTGQEMLTVNCFGDSITHMSFYFDPLADILYQKYPGQISLVNTGIGGNRVLYDGHFPDVPCDGKCFGEAALTRFERDVYEDDTPDILFIMEGVNDCCHGPSNGYLDEIPTGKEVFDGIMKLSDQAREKGTSVYLCTVLPFNYYESVGSEISEKIRQDLNTLIRNAGDRIAGVVDAEAKVRRPEDPKMIQADLHLGDSLHPNVAGGKIVAEEIAAVLTQEISNKLK